MVLWFQRRCCTGIVHAMAPRGKSAVAKSKKKAADKPETSPEAPQSEELAAPRRSARSKAAPIRDPKGFPSHDEKESHDVFETKSRVTTKEAEMRSASTSVDVKTETDVDDDAPFVKVEDEIPETKRRRRRRLPSADAESIRVKPEVAITIKNSKFIGAHVSAAGGPEHAVTRAAEQGARAFGLFLRPQRQWNCKPLSRESADRFRRACREHDFSPGHILPHGSYLLNCGSPDSTVLEKSRATLVDELKRCEMLGLLYYNFHPGSTCGASTAEECVDRIAECINSAHEETTYAITVVENMCGQGHTVGGDFRELRAIIDGVKDKSRIGVCLDTCHAFAAGYDLSTQEGFEETIKEFDSVIGLSYLKALHLNDSKGKLGSHLDRHENIGKGFLGPEAFRRIVNDPRFDGLPMILETPETDYAAEIASLYGTCSS